LYLGGYILLNTTGVPTNESNFLVLFFSDNDSENVVLQVETIDVIPRGM
jgi:hypothetical protein